MDSYKVLHILDHSLPIHSGYSFRTQSILQSQTRRGWQPTALTSLKHNLNRGIPVEGSEIIEGIRFYRSEGNRPSGVFGQLTIMSSLRHRIREVIQTERPEILHVHSPVLNAIPALLTSFPRRIPIVYEIRAFWEDAAVDHGTYTETSWKYRLVRALETSICKRVDQIVVICSGLKGDLLLRGVDESKITIIPNGVNVDNFAVRKESAALSRIPDVHDKRIVGFIGSFYHYEGLDILINAFSAVTAVQPDAMLLLVGGGEVESALKAQVERLNLQSKIVFAGRVPHDEVPNFYAAMDVMVYPRKSMRLTELVTPLKPLEAMAAGKAVVASDIGGHRELISHGTTGLLCPADNPEAVSKAILEILADPGQAQRLAEQGRRWVASKRSWNVTTERYADVYQSCRQQRTQHSAF